MNDEKREEKLNKIIALFKSLGSENQQSVNRDSILSDDPAWNQSEEEYQLEQKKWLEQVKKNKKPDHKTSL